MPPDTAYPRVLIVAAAPVGGISGTGVTLSNLFKDWPETRLAQVHTTEGSVEGSPVKSLRLPESIAPVDFWARSLLRTAGSQPASAPAIAAVPLPTGASASARRHATLRAVADLSPLRYPNSLRRFVAEYRPEVVYSPLGSARIVRLAGHVASLAAAPLVPHFMDDWPHTLYSSHELAGWAHRRMRCELSRTLRHATLGLSISQPMADEYAEEFGFSFLPFANPAHVSDLEPPQASSGREVRLVYVGGLHLGRWDQLLEIADVLRGASQPATLTVFAPTEHLRDRRVPEALTGSLVLGGSLAPDEAVRVMPDADVLVHVESFDPQTLAYTRLSMSTKLSQYLAAGRPILGFGPARQASMALVRTLEAGLVAESRTELQAAIETLLESETSRASMGAVGHAWARDKVDAGQVRSAFRQALGSAATAI